MQISKNKKQQNTPTPWAIAAVIILLLGYGVPAGVLGWWPFPLSGNTEQTQDPAGQNGEDRNIDRGSGDKRPVQYDGPEVPINESSITGVINYKDVQDETLRLRVTIDQNISTGTCDLTLSQGSAQVTKSAPVTSNPSTSTCEGFDIPISELFSGTWNIQIKITDGDKQGKLTGEISV